ncbi:hypothetical protein QQ045_030682 [Rhodiola kirilowii]
MAFNKQVLFFLSLLFILTAARGRTLRSGGYPFTTSAAGSVHEMNKIRPSMGIETFPTSVGCLIKGVPVPPSKPSLRKNHREAEADAAMAEVAGGIW